MTQDTLDARLEVGDLLIIETGEYSDRRWDGPVRMLVSKTRKQLAHEFVCDWKPDQSKKLEWQKRGDPDDFLPWLIRKGYAEDVKCHSWHVGSYDNFNP